ncbi:MAG: M42 family metallopeptidase [Christensenellaceae bacterium]|nr:M42 family metallopeptidase [Christensenellaceae bacterium]
MLRNTLKTLLSSFGPSGSEKNVANTIKTLLAGHVDSLRQDALGNIIVEKYGTDDDAKRIMISAHMDQIGYIVVAIEDEGYLRVQPVGGINLNMCHGRHVIFENSVDGVLYQQPVKDGKPTINDFFIDIGAENKEEAESMVQLGDMCVYVPDVFTIGKDKVCGPAMDNRSACALLVELLLTAENQKNTIVGVFSTQEEVGLRGATVAAYGIDPDIGLAIDVTGAGDTPEVKLPQLKLGAGPANKIKDRSLISSMPVREKIFEAAEAAHVEMQREVLPYGGTDGAAIQNTRSGVPTGVISIPCRYVHSPCETIDMRDMEGALKVLLEFVDLA